MSKVSGSRKSSSVRRAASAKSKDTAKKSAKTGSSSKSTSTKSTKKMGEKEKARLSKASTEQFVSQRQERAASQKLPDFPASQQAIQLSNKVSDKLEVIQPQASTLSREEKKPRAAKVLKGLVKDKEFSKEDATKLDTEIRKGGVEASEVSQLQEAISSKLVKKLDDKSLKRLNETLSGLIAKGVDPGKERKQLLADIEEGNVRKVADSFNSLGMMLDSPHPYKLSDPVNETNRSQADHWTDPETGKVDWSNFHKDPTHVPAKPALTSTMKIHGRDIKIVVEQPPGANLPTAKEVAESISRIRPELLEHVKRVELVNDNPSDAYMWVNQSIDPGTIEVLPTSHKPNEKLRVQALVHEIGHIASIASPTETGKMDWDAYNKAIASDKHPPSQYGTTNPREDYAEFSALHEIYRGTAEEASLRRLFQHRYQAAEHLLS